MKRFEMSELKEKSHIHFIGIGGVSMSGLARLMLTKGHRVSGSDRTKTKITDELFKMGATIFEGQSEKNITDADLVVYTAAVKLDNPELLEAKKRNIRTIDRAEFLGAVMKGYQNAVGVSGTHGKTSTTSMIAYALIFANCDPTVSIGGELDLIGGNFRTGKSDIFVTEACEYTNSFLKFFPTVALITNIEEDHLDFFKDLEDIKNSFFQFARLTEGKGVVIACKDDKNVCDILRDSKLNIVYYGMGKDASIHPENIVYENGYPQFDVYCKDEFCCNLKLSVPGEHNIKNALAAIAVCSELSADIELCKKGLEEYKGVKRRFEKKGSFNGAIVMDDYAHHPTEIKTTLKAGREVSANKLWCVFQPHTYTRTKTLWDEFVCAFDDADEIILLDIYAAREVYDGKTNSKDLADEIAKRGKSVRYFKDFDSAEKFLRENLGSGDIIFTMGAGDVYKIGEELIKG